MGRRVTEGCGLHPAKTGLFGPLLDHPRFQALLAADADDVEH
jgi:hypothetical protein